jgi:hypothetical protein
MFLEDARVKCNSYYGFENKNFFTMGLRIRISAYLAMMIECN